MRTISKLRAFRHDSPMATAPSRPSSPVSARDSSRLQGVQAGFEGALSPQLVLSHQAQAASPSQLVPHKVERVDVADNDRRSERTRPQLSSHRSAASLACAFRRDLIDACYLSQTPFVPTTSSPEVPASSKGRRRSHTVTTPDHRMQRASPSESMYSVPLRPQGQAMPSSQNFDDSINTSSSPKQTRPSVFRRRPAGLRLGSADGRSANMISVTEGLPAKPNEVSAFARPPTPPPEAPLTPGRRIARRLSSFKDRLRRASVSKPCAVNQPPTPATSKSLPVHAIVRETALPSPPQYGLLHHPAMEERAPAPCRLSPSASVTTASTRPASSLEHQPWHSPSIGSLSLSSRTGYGGSPSCTPASSVSGLASSRSNSSQGGGGSSSGSSSCCCVGGSESHPCFAACLSPLTEAGMRSGLSPPRPHAKKAQVISADTGFKRDDGVRRKHRSDEVRRDYSHLRPATDDGTGQETFNAQAVQSDLRWPARMRRLSASMVASKVDIAGPPQNATAAAPATAIATETSICDSEQTIEAPKKLLSRPKPRPRPLHSAALSLKTLHELSPPPLQPNAFQPPVPVSVASDARGGKRWTDEAQEILRPLSYCTVATTATVCSARTDISAPASATTIGSPLSSDFTAMRGQTAAADLLPPLSPFAARAPARAARHRIKDQVWDTGDFGLPSSPVIAPSPSPPALQS
ncbi:uncharacterized protein PFL1_02341 [Pseudozyma flocculosa PF-1]|uniref:Uncharacterized protein n=1 Tax=Pseudozyma flocculosa TaxID=84751 RepID=A0A5C3F5Q9_9BASI|nr:uncharacterized protein PFL1_02341 [Pseudozyma flocculosa PF-1]EPQ30225.1 hypothetical protein PFL1_02341 [Pseudozyma flocculosa PF-1]SPO39844.1 uncharacterized protein PSFLO_05325 [Pseudozyma flocculosa]